MKTPTVSVYIPTRNRATLLTRALASVWLQGIEDIEVIVVDDGSTDDTPRVLRSMQADSRLRWFRNEVPAGACAARNTAIQAARGRFITGLDDDDEMLPGRLAALLAAIQPQDSFVCGSDWIQLEDGRRRLRIVSKTIDRSAILTRNVAGNQILTERNKLLAIGGFDESLPAGQDYDLWIRMVLQHGPGRGLLRPLQIVHAHSDGPRISIAANRRLGYWMVYKKHRSEMDKNNRSGHLYNLRRASGHRTRLPRDFRFYARLNRLRLLLHGLRDLTLSHPA